MLKWGIAAGALCVASAGLAADKGPPDYGADISWDAFVQTGEPELKGRLVDPDSAKVEWPYNIVQGTLKGMLQKTRYGWWTCGRVNARNRMGGYVGSSPFLIMIRDGVVTSIDIGGADGMDTATLTCNDALKKGMLQPAPGPSVPPPPAGTPVIGIELAAAPDGAYIKSVFPGGGAEAAGLTSGMVISTVNGISLKGMDLGTMTSILRGAGDVAKLGVIGKGEVSVSKR